MFLPGSPLSHDIHDFNDSTAPVDLGQAGFEIEDGALEELPMKRIRTASSMNEQLQEQIALERAKKQQQDEELRARRASRFERKSDFNAKPGRK